MSGTGMGTESGPELVRLLSGWLAGTGITLLELRTPAGSVRLTRAGTASAAPAHAPVHAPAYAASPGTVTVTAPGVGVFLHRHPVRAEPLTVPGQAVRAGEVVGLLQVGSLLLHVLAPADGTVAEAVAPPGSTVGYGAALLRLARESP